MAVIPLTEIALFALCNITAAARAFSDDRSSGRKQHVGSQHRFIGLDQLADHTADALHKGFRGFFAALDLLEPVFPLSGHQGRLKLFRQHGNQGDTGVSRDQAHRLFALFALHKAGGHQLFQNGRAGGRRPKPFAFSIFGHFFRTGGLHCRKQRILGIVFGRCRLALFDGGRMNRKGLSFVHGRQCLCRIRSFILTFAGVMRFHQRPPAGIHDRAAFRAEAVPGTFQSYRRFRVFMGLRNGAEQAQGNQFQYGTLSGRQAGERSFFEIGSGNDRMVIGDLFIIDDLRGVYMKRDAAHLRHCRSYIAYECWQTVRHVRGQIPAVGAGIGAELLFIEALEVVQRLLGGEAKNPVGVALQGGEVVKGRRLFSFVLALDRLYHCHLTAAGFLQGFGLRLILHAFAASIKPRKPQRDRIERLRLESVDFRFPLYDQRQRGRHHTANIQRAVIENGEKPRGVNAYQPVGLAAAERRRIEIVVCAAVFECFKALADRRIFHGRNPQALHGLVTFVEQIDRAKDGLALAPGIAGIDDLAHVLPVHERVEQGKLLGLISGNRILPAFRQNRKVFVAPFGILFVVGGGFGQFGQVSKAPGHDVAAAHKIAVLALVGTKDGGDGFAHRGLF